MSEFPPKVISKVFRPLPSSAFPLNAAPSTGGVQWKHMYRLLIVSALKAA